MRPSAGHPRAEARLTVGSGTPKPFDVGGLALGIDGGQHYEEARVRLEPGGRRRPLHGRGWSRRAVTASSTASQRLDDALTANARAPGAGARADALLADCLA